MFRRWQVGLVRSGFGGNAARRSFVIVYREELKLEMIISRLLIHAIFGARFKYCYPKACREV